MTRAWGSHYPDGALVLTHFGEEMGLAVVIAHTGDCHHKSVRVHVKNGADTPHDVDHLVADPSDVYYSYWMGPVVTRLDTTQFMSLAGGIDVPKLQLHITAETLLSMQGPGFSGPYRAS